jgi:uncharacterized damage-inducible protein DinB
MLSVHELLKARFDMTRKYLDRVLVRFTENDLSWRPAEGMRTVRGQLLEIADKERESIKWIQTGVWPDEDPPTFNEETATMAEITAAMKELRVNTFAYIDSLSEADLERLIHSEEGWLEALNLTDCPIHEVLRNIGAHEWYHTAQLITYLWLRGDVPDSW